MRDLPWPWPIKVISAWQYRQYYNYYCAVYRETAAHMCKHRPGLSATAGFLAFLGGAIRQLDSLFWTQLAYIKSRTHGDYFPEQNTVRPDVTAGSKHAVTYWLDRHPLEWQTAARQLTVLVSSVDDSSKPKVTHFNHLVVAQQHVASSQVAVDKVAPRQILLTAAHTDNTLRLSVCLSHSDIVSQRLNVQSKWSQSL